MARKTLEEIKKELSERGFKYIEGEYQNLDSPLTVECSKGHQTITSLKKVRRDPTCPVCEMYSQIKAEEVALDKPPKKKGKRILSLDNATTITGYAIFEDGKLISSGIKELPKTEHILSRILHTKQWMVGMIKTWEIDVLGLEDVYYSGNPQVCIILSKLLGVLENAGLELKLKVYSVKPGVWRKHCQIKGRKRSVQKENAQKYVKDTFGVIASQDKADAICLGSYIVAQESAPDFGDVVTWE